MLLNVVIIKSWVEGKVRKLQIKVHKFQLSKMRNLEKSIVSHGIYSQP